DENYLNEGVFMEGEFAEIQKFQAKSLPTVSKELLTYLNNFCLVYAYRDYICQNSGWKPVQLPALLQLI
ncbi:4756_t:CDS:2, partial [Funneliformis geosporum]